MEKKEKKETVRIPVDAIVKEIGVPRGYLRYRREDGEEVYSPLRATESNLHDQIKSSYEVAPSTVKVCKMSDATRDELDLAPLETKLAINNQNQHCIAQTVNSQSANTCVPPIQNTVSNIHSGNSRLMSILGIDPTKPLSEESKESLFLAQHYDLLGILDSKFKGTTDWKMNALEYGQAVRAYRTNPLKEAKRESVNAFYNSLFALPSAAIVAGFAYLGYENFMTDQTMGQKVAGFILGGILTSPVWGLALAGLKYNLFGNHPISGYGNYYETPSFGLFDNLRFRKNWLTIAKLQKEEKIRSGTKDIAEGNEDSYYHGGP